MKTSQFYSILIGILILCIPAFSIADSGGPLSPEQAAYDVQYYDLDLEIFPESQSISGTLLCQVEILESINKLVLDLDDNYTVSQILFKVGDNDFEATTYLQASFQILIDMLETVSSGDIVTVEITYSGIPTIAVSPPWGVGFVWETTEEGNPLYGVACEDQGGDIWWPCKDHPSDEPDSISIHLTVPNPLICVSNGKYLGSEDNGNNTSTFNWFVSTPINNYNVTFYAADFELIEMDYESTIGNTIPFEFWVLPEYYETAIDYMDIFKQEFDFLEQLCGPFPFGTDKHGWAHAPYWGMEHQSIIAYGHDFTTNNWGYDYIHYHELAHEWWGNLITAGNWADIWIHEGIATYTEALYVEHLTGMEDYIQFMKNKRPGDFHDDALAPYEELTASQGFALNPYSRGASVMHTLRYHIGDENLFELMKRWAYPDPNDLDNTNGRLCRILNTEDLKIQAEEVTGMELDPFFDVFFREASYPILKVEKQYNQTLFSWDTENDVLLDVNIPIVVNGEEYTVIMNEGVGSIDFNYNDEMIIDPDKWILMAYASITINVETINENNIALKQNYPNPFYSNSIIEFEIPIASNVQIKIYDLLGTEIATILDAKLNQGEHSIELNGDNLSKGIYFYEMKIGDYTITKKFIKE